MRFFAISDLHVDYSENAEWVERLSYVEYQQDILILAGDVSGRQSRLAWCLQHMVRRFRQVLFVPGNHEFWLIHETELFRDSLDKFVNLQELVTKCGASTKTFQSGDVTVVPMLGWYDYSFGEPSDELRATWLDYRACRWPAFLAEPDLVTFFEKFNDTPDFQTSRKVITFSHFLPRIDVMPMYIPSHHRRLYPVLGSTRLERQLRAFSPIVHLYGHSHVNRNVTIDGVQYVNNALGYPSEAGMTSRKLLCVYES